MKVGLLLFLGGGSVVLSRTVGLLFCLGVGGSVVLSQGVGLLLFLRMWVCGSCYLKA